MSRGRARRSFAPALLALITVLVGVIPAASAEVVPTAPSSTDAERQDARGPDLSQSVVQDREPRKFRAASDVERGTIPRGEKAPKATVPDMVTEGESEFTRTVANGDGSFTSTLSVEPVNWKDAGGSWQAFDDTLVATTGEAQTAGFGATNRSGPFRVELASGDKARSDGQLLSLSAGDARVDVFLPGAQPTSADLRPNGRDVTFTDAASGADIRYRVAGPALKEEIVLDAAPSAEAPLSFAFELALTGLTALPQKDGSIALNDVEGVTVFVIPPSFALDSADKDTTERHSPVATSLEPLGADRIRLTLTPDAGWLLDPDRVYPVVIDPTFHYGNGRSDTSSSTAVQIDQANPTTNYNGVSPVTVGKNGTGQGKEVLVSFPNLDVVPTDATVVNATMSFTVNAGGTAGLGMEIRRVTSSWAANTVTWNTAPTHAAQKSMTTAIGANSVNLTQMVYQWVRGAFTNYGVRFRSTGGNNQSIVIPGTGTGSPSLSVTYVRQLRLGIDDLYSYEGHDFGGGTSASVELSTGNLVVSHDEGAIGAKGFSVELASVYNSRDPYGQNKANPDSWAVYGEDWSFSQDQRLFTTTGNAVVWKDGTGRIRIYTLLQDQSGIRTYSNPIQYGWTLTKNTTTNVWTLTANSGGEVLTFDSGGKLTKRADRNGNDLDYAYDASGRLTSITDAASRTTTFDYASSSGSPTRLHEITDMAGRVTRFAYSAYGNLTGITDAYGTADARTTTFEYYGGDQMVAVTNPNGDRALTDYSILYSFEGATSGFAMAAGSTGTLTSSTTQAYAGTSSLKMQLGSAGVPLNAEVVKTFSPAKVWNSAQQELIAFVYVASGAPAINLTVRASQACSGGSQTATAALTAGGWNEVHLESVDVEPSCPLGELGFKFVTPGGQTYTTGIYLDHVYFKGVTYDFTDATLGNAIVQQFTYNFDATPPTTVVGRLDADGTTLQPTTYRYRDIGQVDQVTDALSNVTAFSFDADWRVTTIDPPGSAAASTTFTYPSSRMEWSTSTTDGLTSRQGVDATTGDLRYDIDPVNESERAASHAFLATIYNRDGDGNVSQVKLNWYSGGASLDSDPFPSPASTVSQSDQSYTSAGEPAVSTLPNGTISTNSWDSHGNLTQHVDNYVTSGTTLDENLTTDYAYDLATIAGKAGLVTETTEPDGAATTYVYDVLGRETSHTTIGSGLSSGITTTTAVDANGLVTSTVVDGVMSESTYDTEGRLTQTIVDKGSARLNLTSEYRYAPMGAVTATRDPRGTVSRSFYDASGRLVETIQNCTNSGTTVPTTGWETCAGTGTANATWNLSSTYAYDAAGNQTSEVAPNGRETRHGYNALNQLEWTTENYVASPASPDQSLTTYLYYDDKGQQVAVKAPTANRTTFSVTRTIYDDQGRVTSTIANCTDSGHTLPANPDTCSGAGSADADTNVVTSYSYDANGNKLSETVPDPSATTGTGTVTTLYAYDGQNRLCRVLENAGSTTGFTCTSTVTGGTASSKVSTSYAYDESGNLTTATDGRGNTQSYGYDALGRMTSRTDGLSATITWTYDARGNRLTQANRVGSPAVAVSWTYDKANRMETRTADSVTVTYAYDENGNLTSASGSASTISQTYDRLNRPLDTTPDDGSTHTVNTYSFTAPTRSDTTGSSTFAIDMFGRETSATLPFSGSTFSTTYRADGQPLHRSDPNANEADWTYDALGRLLTKNTTGSGGTPSRAAYTYTYNRAGLRLSEASTISGDPGNGTATFGYDTLGRLSSYGSPLGSGSSQTFGWQPVPNRDSVATGGGTPVTKTYNAADRISTAGYTYDADGNVTLQPGQELEWDSLGRLKVIKNSSTHAAVSTYRYDSIDRLRTVARSSGTIRFRYVGLSTRVSEIVDDTTGASQLRVGSGPTGQRYGDWTGTGSNFRVYGTNAHGDTTWVASSSGSVIGSSRYDAWGNNATASGQMPEWRFQGSWFDTATALYWVVARWYAPTLGSFLGEDSIVGETHEPMARHSRYTYGPGDSVNYSDQNGLSYRVFNIKNRGGFFGTLLLSGFIAAKYNVVSIPGASAITVARLYGDDRYRTVDGITSVAWGPNCYDYRFCVHVYFDTGQVVVNIHDSCGDWPNPVGGWWGYGCSPAFSIFKSKKGYREACLRDNVVNGTNRDCQGEQFSRFNVAEAQDGTLTLSWDITQSRLAVRRPDLTVNGSMKIHPPKVLPLLGRRAWVQYGGEGFPSEEMYWSPDYFTGTTKVLFRHEEGPYTDMGSGGDWSGDFSFRQ